MRYQSTHAGQNKLCALYLFLKSAIPQEIPKVFFFIFEAIVCTEIHRGNLFILCYYEMGRGETVIIFLLLSSQENSKLYKNKRYPGKHMVKIHRLPSSEKFLAPFGCITAYFRHHYFFFFSITQCFMLTLSRLDIFVCCIFWVRIEAGGLTDEGT